VHIHATLDTELLTNGGKDVHHLSNMMVFHKPDNKSHQNHTGFKARRHNSGTQMKAVVNLKEMPSTAGLEFLGVTRDHLVDGESALRHPSSAGMFAVCIDGVVTIRAPMDPNEASQLVPGDFLYIESTAAAESIDGKDESIETFALKKAKATATADPLDDGEKKTSGNFLYNTWTDKPIGRLVEMRNTPVDGVKEFRVNLCPFGAPYAMLDTGVNPKNQEKDKIKVFSIENDPLDGYALTYLDYGAIQPTKREASADFTPNAAIFGTIAVQGRTGASQAMTGIIEQDETAAEKAHPTYEQWAESAHGKSVSAQARDFVQQAATSSNAKASVFINHEGEARLIENATDFRKNVLSTANEHRTIQQGDTTVSIYAAGRKRSAQTSSSAATKKSRSRK
jgi:hypothetical protein